MERVLSQEEINAFFSAMSSEDWNQEHQPEKDERQAVDDDLRFDPEWNMSRRQSSGRSGERIAELAGNIQFKLSGETPGSKLRIGNLLRMSVGDIIELKQGVGDPLVLCVGGVPKFTGKIVQRHRKKMFSISGRTNR
jgi:flagellar motor switch protein FliM